MQSVRMAEAGVQFLNYIDTVSHKKKHKPFLIMHGTDYITLYSSMANVNLLSKTKIKRIIDFQESPHTDESFLSTYNCSTSLVNSNPTKKNLYETVSKKQADHAWAHDALYDGTVLQEIYWQYKKDYYMYTFKHFHYENARKPEVVLNIVKISVAKSMKTEE